MRVFCLAIALLTAIQAPAFAEAPPYEGSVGLAGFPLYPPTLGLDGEIGPRGGSWRVGGVALAQYNYLYAGPGVYPHAATAWGWYGTRLGNGDELGGLIGLNYYFKEGLRPANTDGALAYFGAVVGVTYAVKSGPLSLRVSPHAVLSPGRTWADDWFGRSGLPWFEVGYDVTPNLRASLRFTETVLKLAWIF